MNESYLEFAKNLALEAGKILINAQNTQFSQDYKQGEELVTSVDLELDDFICKSIHNSFPEHSILSEESSPNLDFSQLNEQDYIWVIDPIDGTVNFAHQYKHVAISIGLVKGSQRLLGVVYAPFLNELFWAQKGSGAYLNNQKIKVSNQVTLHRALVATGFPYNKNNLDPIIARVRKILENCQDIRRNGSAALDLCWVAAGRLEAYYETVKPWDMVAGALIATEAGAKIGYHKDEVSGGNIWPISLRSDHLLVANPDLYQAIYQLLHCD